LITDAEQVVDGKRHIVPDWHALCTAITVAALSHTHKWLKQIGLSWVG